MNLPAVRQQIEQGRTQPREAAGGASRIVDFHSAEAAREAEEAIIFFQRESAGGDRTHG